MACSFCVIKIATSRISPAWRSHSQRVLISVHSEQLCLFGCPSSVLLPCVPKSDARRSSAWLDRWLLSRRLHRSMSLTIPEHTVTLFPFPVLHKSYGSPNRSILFAHLGVRKKQILDLPSSRIPLLNAHIRKLGRGCRSARSRGRCMSRRICAFPHRRYEHECLDHVFICR